MDDVAALHSISAASLEMPAGTGKTQLLARLAHRESQDGRVLILTHTHSGIDAIRRRLRSMQAPAGKIRVCTIDGWALRVARAYPSIAGLRVPEEPDWRQTRAYHAAAVNVLKSGVLQRTLTESYSRVLVDEYQDCQTWQHQTISATTINLPVIVFGDPLQGLLTFGGCDPVVWGTVEAAFPRYEPQIHPWRWETSNPVLGRWLLEARTDLKSGRRPNLAGAPVTVRKPSEIAEACASLPPTDHTVVITAWPSDAKMTAQELRGRFTMIEPVDAGDLMQLADAIDRDVGPALIREMRTFVESCLAAPRPQVSSDMLNALLREPTAATALTHLQALSRTPSVQVCRKEAWTEMQRALRLAVNDGIAVHRAVFLIRDQLRESGRKPERRIVGRPLLVKGLEFEHAVVALSQESTAEQWYVSMTRGSKSLTVVEP